MPRAKQVCSATNRWFCADSCINTRDKCFWKMGACRYLFSPFVAAVLQSTVYISRFVVFATLFLWLYPSFITIQSGPNYSRYPNDQSDLQWLYLIKHNLRICSRSPTVKISNSFKNLTHEVYSRESVEDTPRSWLWRCGEGRRWLYKWVPQNPNPLHNKVTSEYFFIFM